MQLKHFVENHMDSQWVCKLLTALSQNCLPIEGSAITNFQVHSNTNIVCGMKKQIRLNIRNRDYLCFQMEPTTKEFVTGFIPVLVSIHFHHDRVAVRRLLVWFLLFPVFLMMETCDISICSLKVSRYVRCFNHSKPTVYHKPPNCCLHIVICTPFEMCVRNCCQLAISMRIWHWK